MSNAPKLARPPFSEVINAWKAELKTAGHPTEMLWVFDENLCVEHDPARPGGFKVGIQTRFTPPPPGAEQIAYEHFHDFAARIVFYRLGNCHGKSVCLMLCDEWFEPRGPKDGFVRRDDWLVSFRPGGAEELEEIVDATRWEQRVLKGRPLHDLDFSMTLRAVHETLAHGRVLSAYEHYALKLLHAWKRLIKAEG